MRNLGKFESVEDKQNAINNGKLITPYIALLPNMQLNYKPVIYSLYNHVCDGTANTCINTGIKLLSREFIQEHPKFQITISFIADQDNPVKSHIIRCGKVATPYHGFYIRVEDTDASKYRVRWSCKSNQSYHEYLTQYQYSFDNIIIIFNFIDSIFTVINRDSNGSYEQFSFTMDYIFNDIPFVIGGSVINGIDETGGWKEMWSGTITKLVIKDIL